MEKSLSCLGRARKFSIKGLRTDALTSTVIKESDTKYRLTGITMVQRTSNLFYAPKDPAIARIGGKKSARYDHRVFTKFYTASVGRQPDWFWRRRLNESLFIRLGRLKQAMFLDWQSKLNLMNLVSDRTWSSSSGLANRGRVLWIMLALEKAYLG